MYVHIHVLYMYMVWLTWDLHVHVAVVHATQIMMTMMVVAHQLRSQDYLHSPTIQALTKVKPILFTYCYMYVVYFISQACVHDLT